MVKSREEVMQVLARNRVKILGFGVRRLGLFGSFSRGENRAASDLDFVVEFQTKSFDAYMDLKMHLEDIFDCHVDLVIPETIKPRLRSAILKETVYAPGL